MRCLAVLLALASGAASGLEAAETPKPPAIYVSLCAPCHGPDGRARTPAARKLKVKDLTLSRISDEEIRKQVLEGRRDPAGNQQMPPFKDKVNKEHLEELIAHVKSIRK